MQTLDVAKRLMDFGYHPPTIYFPLPAVTGGAGALMIEPTETETPETLDAFCDAMARSPTRRRAIRRSPRTRRTDRAPPPRRNQRRANAQAALGSPSTLSRA